MSATLQALEVSRLKLLTKEEVHLHLEGYFEAMTIAQWAKAEGFALPRPQEDLLKFSGLADFLGLLSAAQTSIDVSFASADINTQLLEALKEW
jgi:adenosine deaminase